MQPVDYSAITLDNITLPGAAGKDISLKVMRLDKIHPVISGNKIFKLTGYLEEAKALGKTRIETYGGAWSNHIAAAAAACKMAGIACTGYIRGEEPVSLSSTLRDAAAEGMQLVFLNRESYRHYKRDSSAADSKSYIIPEGGFGKTGALGAATILDHVKTDQYTHICCAAGTGTMAAGIAQSAKANQRVIAFSALKNNLQLQDDILSMTGEEIKQPFIIHDYHFGGFAKHTPELFSFMNEIYLQNRLPTDFVYTGKMIYGINDLAQQNFFPAGSNILVIHSGGLQGNSSLEKGTLIF